jgi:ABC-type transport system involved in multi-copper enzyme maturation permease subunit
MSRSTKGWLFTLLGYTLVLELMLAAAILYWPNFRDNLGAVKLLSKPLPVLGDIIAQVESMGVAAYVVGQHFFKGCNVLGAAAAALIGAAAVAGEAQRGTLEIWLARPVTRLRLASERYLSGQAVIWLGVFLTTLTIPLLLTQVDEIMRLDRLMLCALHQCLFLGAVYSITYLISCASSEPMRISMGVLFFMIFQFGIYMVKTVTHWSVYRLADIEVFHHILVDGVLDWGIAGPMLAINLAGFLGGYVFLKRRCP